MINPQRETLYSLLKLTWASGGIDIFQYAATEYPNALEEWIFSKG